MSLADIRLQTAVASGRGAKTAVHGAIPVLFGTRIIENPRIIWIKSRDLPQVVGTLPPDNRQFSLYAALCHGEIDDVYVLICNGIEVSSTNLSYLANAALDNFNEFRAPRFFSEKFQLSGYCSVFRGELGATNVFSGASYLTSAIVPENTTTQFRGVAVANLRVEKQNSSSMNNWGFMTYRSGRSGWQDDFRQIQVAKKRIINIRGGSRRDRHIVLAVDCSSINGLPVDGASNLTDLEAEYRPPTDSEGLNIAITGTHINVQAGIFKYRYDVIREQVLATLKEYENILQASESGASYNWSLEVVLLGGQIRRLAGYYSHPIEAVQFDYSDSVGTRHTGESHYTVRSDDRISVSNYIEALSAAVQIHGLLRAATANDTTFDRYLTIPSSSSGGRVRERTFKNLITAPINPNYNPGGDRISQFVHDDFVGLNRYNYTPCDFADAVRWVIANRPEFGGFDEKSLVQISWIVGPAWPGSLRGEVIERKGGSFDDDDDNDDGTVIPIEGYPPVRDIYIDANEDYNLIEGEPGSCLYRWNYTHRVPFGRINRKTIGESLDDLYAHMGVSDFKRMVGDKEFETIRLDAISIDGYVTGENTLGAFGSEGSRSVSWHTRQVLDTNPYSAIDRWKKNPVEKAPSFGYPDPYAPMSFDYWDDFEEMGVNSFDSTANAIGKTLATGMGPEELPIIEERDKTLPIYGMNPAHIIRECLLNPDYWSGTSAFSEANLDEESFTETANRLWQEGLGLGLLWDRQSSVSNFIDDILRHIDAVMYERESIVYLRLIGKTHYDPPEEGGGGWSRKPLAIYETELGLADERPLNESNVVSITDFKAPREDEAINSIVVQFKNYDWIAERGIERSNDDLVARYGVISKTNSYPGLLTEIQAGKIADRDLEREQAGLITCTIDVLPEVGIDINPGDLIFVSWDQLNIKEIYFRVLSVVLPATGRKNVVTLEVIMANAGDIETT